MPERHLLLGMTQHIASAILASVAKERTIGFIPYTNLAASLIMSVQSA